MTLLPGQHLSLFALFSNYIFNSNSNKGKNDNNNSNNMAKTKQFALKQKK